MTRFHTGLFVVLVVLAGAACGGTTPANAVPAAGAAAEPEPAQASRPAPAGDAPDACRLFTAEEIGEMIGRSVRAGVPEEQPAGASQCRYRTPSSTVTVNVHATDTGQFREFRELVGPEAETAAGIGDEAYFWGPGVIYGRVGARGFSVRINDDLGAGLRPAMLKLAQAAAARLQ